MKIKLFIVVGFLALVMTSCHSYRYTMREPNSHVEFVASDFELSEPFTGEATVTRILWIDWERTFGTTTSGFVSKGVELPIVGNMVSYGVSGGANYALYDLLKKHPGYDVIFYPQVEVIRHAPVLGSGLYSTTTYKVTARLGKMKKK